ncbi:MAG TPA: tetratricopeptide repeat protein [Tepidisphaeraceae bacterium]|jgi:tetratricopeptide (TPR) repeat protein
MDSLLQERWDDLIAIDGSIAVEIELCMRFVRDFPNFAPAWLKYGGALIKVFRLDAAEQALHSALNLLQRNRRNPECVMGHIFRHRADIATAEQWYRQAIATDPDDTAGYIYLGAMLARVGRLIEAEKIHRRGTECSKGCVDEAFLNLGLVLRALEQYSAAADCFTEAVRRDPHYQLAKHALRDCLRAEKFLSAKISQTSSAGSDTAKDDSDNSDWRRIIRMWDSSAFRIELCKRYVHAHPDSSPGWTAYACGLSDLSRFDLETVS